MDADGITWEADPRHAELMIDKEASDRYRANTTRAQYLSSDTPDIQVECQDLPRRMHTAIESCRDGTEEVTSFSRSASEVGLVVQVAEACHTHRILVCHGPCWLHPNQEECFWMCSDAGDSTVCT